MVEEEEVEEEATVGMEKEEGEKDVVGKVQIEDEGEGEIEDVVGKMCNSDVGELEDVVGVKEVGGKMVVMI